MDSDISLIWIRNDKRRVISKRWLEKSQRKCSIFSHHFESWLHPLDFTSSYRGDLNRLPHLRLQDETEYDCFVFKTVNPCTKICQKYKKNNRCKTNY